jgi:hypothetical protein
MSACDSDGAGERDVPWAHPPRWGLHRGHFGGSSTSLHSETPPPTHRHDRALLAHERSKPSVSHDGPVKPWEVVAAVGVFVLVALIGVRFVSARTAENGCTEVAEQRGDSGGISGYDWSWSPLGTTCVFDEGRVSETRIIW